MSFSVHLFPETVLYTDNTSYPMLFIFVICYSYFNYPSENLLKFISCYIYNYNYGI